MTLSDADAGAPSDTRQMTERERAGTVDENVPWRTLGLVIILLSLLIGFVLTR